MTLISFTALKTTNAKKEIATPSRLRREWSRNDNGRKEKADRLPT